MNYTSQTQDASMEDILSSIRKILSSDEENPQNMVKPSAPEPLELVDVVPDEKSSLKVMPKEIEPELPPCKEASIDSSLFTTNFISQKTLSASISALSSLKDAAKEPPLKIPSGHTSIEDLAKDLLFPLLKEWVDQNLPALVEKIVREEIQCLTKTILK